MPETQGTAYPTPQNQDTITKTRLFLHMGIASSAFLLYMGTASSAFLQHYAVALHWVIAPNTCSKPLPAHFDNHHSSWGKLHVMVDVNALASQDIYSLGSIRDILCIACRLEDSSLAGAVEY